jgi:predicted amidohydrolase YtcJ
MAITVYQNSVVFTGDPADPLAESVAIADDHVLAVGSEEDVCAAAGNDARHVDLNGAFTMPGMVEGHTHLAMFGQALSKVQLRDCDSIAEIQQRLRDRRAELPDATYLLGVGWRFDALEGKEPTATIIDEAVKDIPVLLDANDLHSTWVNTAALEAMNVTRDTPEPVGGEIVRDKNGDVTGFLKETASMTLCWGYVTEVATEADRDDFLQRAFTAYLESGVTAGTEMGLDEAEVAALKRWIERHGNLPFPIAAHWMLQPSGNEQDDLAQIERAAQVRDEISQIPGNETLEIVGVKFIMDGVIDACTAAMHSPYVHGEQPDPIWSEQSATPIAIAADQAQLQLALHAIGDAASEIALNVIEACIQANGVRESRRPRIEHLESVTDETIQRMAVLGVTASMQPVHCDPAIMPNWKAVLGDERAERGFPWQKFREAGVRLALGTDAPTAPHEPLDNLFIALTARSVLDPGLDPYHPERVFEPGQALQSYSVIPAETSWPEQPAGLRPGAPANLTVFDVNPFVDDAQALRSARVLRTIVAGYERYTSDSGVNLT